jgi:transcriptional regulator of NAD metabolism
MFLPIHVGFWEADDTSIVGSGTAGDVVEFAKVIRGVKSVGILEDQSHAVVGFDEGYRVAPR